MGYWLFKTEPHVFGIADLSESPNKTARWDEIRNYQARNFLRDEVKAGDDVFIYHSQCNPTAIVGMAKAVTDGYPDPSQFDVKSDYFDPKSSLDAPRWYCVDIRWLTTFKHAISLGRLKTTPELCAMALLRQPRLSVSPVSPDEAQTILRLSQAPA